VTSLQSETPEWLQRRERGSAAAIRFVVWLAITAGRPVVRLLLPFICTYFVLFAADARRASRRYLDRVLGRSATILDVFKHFFSFGACVLDRVFLLKGQTQLYELSIQGEDVVDDILAAGTGCVMLGAHIGSFEVLRAAGRRHSDFSVKVVMYEENARKITAALNAINPALANDVISLGREDAFLKIEHFLEQGSAVGILADRSLAHEKQTTRNFLGAPAFFPVAPFRVSAMLRKPVIMMVGLYRGGNRYDIHFERLDLAGKDEARSTQEYAEALMARYVERLEHFCRAAPYNWFNFYNIWL
jgi:predicted LPLAT superfamily acyltransferase